MDAYHPTHPQQIHTISDVVDYLRKELEAISQSLAEFVALDLRTIYRAPVKPREGMIVSADGTSWNPGGGIGIYGYVGGAWVKLSGGGGGATTFLALTDTPANFTGAAGKEVRVNSAETALEFVESREKVTVARTYYVRTDGSDSNTGLVNSAGGAWKTPQKAMDYVTRYLDMHANVTIQFATGTYDALYITAHVGPAYLYFIGDTTTPSNVVITETNALGGIGIALDFDGIAGFVIFRGIKFQNTTTTSLYPCVYIGAGCFAELSYCEYTTTSTAAHIIEFSQGAHVTFTQTQKFTSTATPTYQLYMGSNAFLWANGGNWNINGLGGAYGFLNTKFGSVVDLDSVIFTVVGTPAVYAFMEIAHDSHVTLRNCSVSGTATGYRATIAERAVLDHNLCTGGDTFLPGNAAPVIQTGGMHIHSNGYTEVTSNLVGAALTLTGGTLELGGTTDTTFARSGAGTATIEGVEIARNTITQVHTCSSLEVGHATDTTITRGSAGHLAVEGATVWDSVNDGSGSGLDADLLDGKNTGTSGNTIPLLDGTNTWSGLQTFQLAGVPVRLVNNTDNASVQALKIEGDRATMAANDEVYESYLLSDSGGAQDEIARITGVATNVTAGATQAGRLDFSVRTADVLAKEVQLDGTSFSPAANDGNALGTTTLSWGDLFLATGGVINWNNGNVTITHAANILTVAGGNFKVAAGTTTLAPLQFQSGTNLTTPAAGDCEFDGVQYYKTIDTTSSRGAIPVEQYRHLTAAGGTISTIANFFGATSNISLVASAHYIIDIECFFLNTTAGTVTWTFTNSAAPTGQNIHYEMSPITGIPAPAGSAAAYLSGTIYNDATATKALTATGTLTTAVNHYARFKIYLINGSGTSLKIQATKNVGGTITPGIGSWWRCRRVSPNNIGTFAA